MISSLLGHFQLDLLDTLLISIIFSMNRFPSDGNMYIVLKSHTHDHGVSAGNILGLERFDSLHFVHHSSV
jgi:hypothetical protein